MKCRQQAEQDAERVRNEDRQRPDPHRHRPRLLDQIDDRLAWTLEGHAEIAVERRSRRSDRIGRGLAGRSRTSRRARSASLPAARALPRRMGRREPPASDRKVMSETAKRTKTSPSKRPRMYRAIAPPAPAAQNRNVERVDYRKSESASRDGQTARRRRMTIVGSPE